MRRENWFGLIPKSAILLAVCFSFFSPSANAQIPPSGSNSLERGISHYQQAHFDSASWYLKKAFREAATPAAQLAVQHQQIRYHLAYSQFDSASRILKEAKINLGACSNPHDSLFIRQNWLKGKLALAKDDYTRARAPLFGAKRHLAKAGGSTSLQVDVGSTMALYLLRQDQDEEAEKLLNKLLALPTLSLRQKGQLQGLLGMLYQELRDWDMALQEYEAAVASLEACLAERHPNLAMAYLRLGLLRQIKGRGNEAAQLYQQAMDIQETSLPPNHIQRVLCYNYLGFYHGRQGDHGQALEYFQQALRIVRFHMGDVHRQVASNANNAGNALLKLGRFEEAAENISLAVSVSEQLYGYHHPRVASTYFSLGLSYFNTKDFARAIEAYQKTLEIRQSLRGPQHQSLAEVHNNLGMCYLLTEDYPQASKQFESAVAIGLDSKDWYDASVARYHNNLGTTYRLMGKLEEAFAWHQKALTHLVADFREEDHRQNPSLRNIVDRQVMLEVLSAKAQTYALYSVEKPEALPRTLATFQLATQLIDSLRLTYVHNDSKFKLAEAALPVYEGGIEAAYRLYQQSSERDLFATAFAMSEKSKALLLLQSIKDVNARQFAQIPDSLSQKERSLVGQITRLEEQLFKARYINQEKDSSQVESWQNELFALHRAREALSQRLEAEYPAYHRLKYDLQAHSLEEIQTALAKEGRALVEYFVGEANLGILYLDGSGFRWLMQPLPPNLSEQVQQLRLGLASPLAADQTALLVENGLSLYYELVQPLYEMGADSSKAWLIVPDGVLGYLPFEVLLSKRPTYDGAYKTYDFLLFAQRLSYTYSAEIWLEMRQQVSNADRRLLAFAPSFGSDDNIKPGFDPLRSGFSPLAHNREEAEAVGASMRGKVLVGAQATETAFRQMAGQYQIVHLSSHARVNDQNPLYSQIAFSQTQDPNEDGLITVAELFEMRLPVEMIVLSACETGVGKLYRGEGVSSQAKGFAYAGAKSIITTLWSINDAASSLLMPDFYEGLQAGLSKDAALRNAKIRYIQQSDQLGAHPFYWAAFVPIGDMAPIESQTSGWVWLGIGLLCVLGLWFVWRGRR